jgi:hypothetical protein
MTNRQEFLSDEEQRFDERNVNSYMSMMVYAARRWCRSPNDRQAARRGFAEGG